jgi:dTDP-4-amino-4,6-dideoxygalactose transaminase
MSSPDLSDAEREAVAAVLRTPRLALGPQAEAFEASVAELVGAQHAISVSSGTTGLHLCVLAAGIEDRDLVLTTPFSFVSSSNVILYERAIPVFVDVDPHSGNLDPQQVAQAVQDLKAGGEAARRWLPRRGAEQHGPLKAILSVDVFGQPADADPLQAIAAEHGLGLIEDACEALGARYKDRPAGKLGDAAVFAFYPNKQVTTGEGGMIVTDRDDWAERMRSLRNQGRAPGDTWLEHTYLGYNYRLDELSAALGRAQMERFEQLLQAREQVAAWYFEALNPIEGLRPPQIGPSTGRLSWFVFVIHLAAGYDRDEVIYQLGEQGIPARPYFSPIHLQPYMVERFDYRPGDYPICEDLGRRGLALPFSGVMTQAAVQRVCGALKKVLA